MEGILNQALGKTTVCEGESCEHDLTWSKVEVGISD